MKRRAFVIAVLAIVTGCGDDDDVRCTGGATVQGGACSCPAPLERVDGVCVSPVSDSGVVSYLDAAGIDASGDAQRDAASAPMDSGVGNFAPGDASGDTSLLGSSGDACVPSDEVCDGVDNDCDGVLDNGVTNACGGCTVLANIKGTPCTVGVGACAASGTYACVGPEVVACSAVPLAPTEEICDGIDNNCSGLVDESVKNECGGCGPLTIGPNAQNRPGVGCAYYWTDSPDCATLGMTVCNGPNLLICEAPKPSCAV